MAPGSVVLRPVFFARYYNNATLPAFDFLLEDFLCNK